MPPVPLGRAVLRRHRFKPKQPDRQAENVRVRLRKGCCPDTGRGHGVQATVLSINGLLRFDFNLQEGCGMPALLRAGERAWLTLYV